LSSAATATSWASVIVPSWCSWQSTGAAARWCSRWPRVATGRAGHRSTRRWRPGLLRQALRLLAGQPRVASAEKSAPRHSAEGRMASDDSTVSVEIRPGPPPGWRRPRCPLRIASRGHRLRPGIVRLARLGHAKARSRARSCVASGSGSRAASRLRVVVGGGWLSRCVLCRLSAARGAGRGCSAFSSVRLRVGASGRSRRSPGRGVAGRGRPAG
jgi:hypothetical protein